MALQSQDVVDLVNGVLAEQGPLKWTDAASSYQRIPGASQFITRDRIKEHSSPQGVKWTVVYKPGAGAHRTGLFGTTSNNFEDVTKRAAANWTIYEQSYAYDEHMLTGQGTPEEVFDVIKTERFAKMIGLLELLEGDMWTAPSSSTNDEQLWGFPYWIVRNATTGFNGGAATGHTTVAGVDPSLSDRLKNFTGTYSDYTRTDLLRMLKQAGERTRFKAYIPHPSYTGPTNHSINTTYTGYERFTELCENQNDRLGNDAYMMQGRATFWGNPVDWVPYLSYGVGADTTDPFIGISWPSFEVACQTGFVMREKVFPPIQTQATVVAVNIRLATQLICRDRSQNFVIYKA